MNLRVLKNEFKQPIYKEDIKPVLKNGILTMLLFSIIVGLITFFLAKFFNMRSSIVYYLLGFYIARSVALNYYSRHILYPILSVVLLFIGMFISETLFNLLLNFNLSSILPSMLSSILYILDYFNPFSYLNAPSSTAFINQLISLLVFLYIIYTTFQRSKNNYY